MRLVLIGILGFVAWSFYAIFTRTYYPFAHGMPLDQIRDFTRLRVPPGTDLVHSVCQQLPGETTILAVLEIPHGDVSALVGSAGNPLRTSRTSRLGIEEARGVVEREWWTPDAPVRFLAVRRPNVGMLVGLDDPEKATVYLIWGWIEWRPEEDPVHR